MRNVLDISLKNLKWIRTRKKRMSNALLLLSFVVTVSVFWGLRQPGLTLAGDASCGILEHTHDIHCETEVLVCGRLEEEAHTHEDGCYEWDLTCELEEHVHRITCYSDATADVETVLDWQEMFADYPYTGDLRVDLVDIAKTQVGYSESMRNFEADSDGVRRGYTRYGAWYGTPYRDWSAMFVSFCLHYAGADMDETPGNTGADSMAKLWKNLGKYAPADEYSPVSGDLVFFDDNTVGIVAEINATTIYVIRGDAENAVCTDLFAMADDAIVGWGVTVGTVPEVERPLDIELQDRDDLLDISRGPAFYIFADVEGEQQVENYSFRNARAAADLLDYLAENGGSYFFTLLDKNNQELPKDENGNYIAETNTGYKLTMSLNGPQGFLPGTYQYQLPNGVKIDGGVGEFYLGEEDDPIKVGSWEVTDDGLITMVFDDNIKSYTDVTISATMGIQFSEQEEPIDFDGKITVTVEKPPEQQNPTKLNKWGYQGGVPDSPGDDPGKIYWKLEMIGDKDSQIPGSTLTDRIIDGEWSKTHRFTESDMAAGLTFGVSDNNGGWHQWLVTADDPNLIWTEKGWEYKMPQTATCQWCGELELGNEGWIYYVTYSSTPDLTGQAGTFGYENEAMIDGANGYAWVNFTHGEVVGEVVKNGFFVSDAAGGKFLWEVKAAIPGREAGQKATPYWLLEDIMTIRDADGNWIANVTNDMDKATVTVDCNGKTIVVPRIQDATEEDRFVWMHYWSNKPGDDGIYYQRGILILCRCRCTEESCAFENCNGVGYTTDDGTWIPTSDFCPCWTETEDTLFTFTYETDGLDIVKDYGGLGYKLDNDVRLIYGEVNKVDDDSADVPISSLVKKELTQDFDGYIAKYNVTVNEAKMVLTDGSPLHIHDVMTETLAYISGSLVITAEDEDGNITTLKQGVDYTVTYDGTGNQMDENDNKVHVLDIVILHPQPVMYTLDYDATLVMPEQVTEGIRYSNSATITLWGEDFSDTSAEKVHADINISAKRYSVEMVKTSAETGEPLGGAVFGLYNENGGLIASGETDADGKLYFQTNVVEGIILREHLPYYLQELKAPAGYRLDDTKYWFCFCNKEEDSCDKCSEILAGKEDAVRIPFQQIGRFSITNAYLSYDLPVTGGSGVFPVIFVSITFIVIPLVYGFMQRRKRGRRRVRRYSRTSANMRRR